MLLALAEPQHPHHAAAQSAFLGCVKDGWASCPLTQNGFLRITAQPTYVHARPLSAAVSLLGLWTARSEHEFWPDDLSLLDGGAIDHARLLSQRHLTDVYLLALALKHGGRMVTLDRSVPRAAVRGATAEHLWVV